MIRHWIVNLFLVVVAGVGGVWYYQQTSQAEQALCALRLDLEVRVANAQKYLDDVDNGVREPIRGISKADITTSINNQRRTIDALANLDCTKEEAPK